VNSNHSLVSGAAFAIMSLCLLKHSHSSFKVDLLYFFFVDISNFTIDEDNIGWAISVIPSSSFVFICAPQLIKILQSLFRSLWDIQKN
jgi:hypothetical protein